MTVGELVRKLMGFQFEKEVAIVLTDCNNSETAWEVDTVVEYDPLITERVLIRQGKPMDI